MRFLVIGLGSMGKRRIKCLWEMGIRDISVFDVREDRRDFLAEEYPDIRVWDESEAAFKNMQTGDSVFVSTPPDQQDEYILHSIWSELNVFVEAGLPERRSSDIISIRNKKGVVAVPSISRLFHPKVLMLFEVMRNLNIGKVLAFTHHCGQYLPSWHPNEDISSFYVGNKLTGACREMVAFELAWLSKLIGQDVNTVMCMNKRTGLLDVPIDDIYQVVFELDGGCLGNMLIDVLSRNRINQTTLVCENGTLSWSFDDNDILSYGKSGGLQIIDIDDDMDPDRMYLGETIAFVKAIHMDGEYPYTFEEDARIMEALSAAEKSSLYRKEYAVQKILIGE